MTTIFAQDGSPIAGGSSSSAASEPQTGAATSSAPDGQASMKMSARGVNVHYGDSHAVKNISLDISKDEVTALIGPSGCGKSTLLRCFNRMNDDIVGCRVTGEILLDGEPINGSSIDIVELRARVGMVFQKPYPFPKSIHENVAYGPRIHGLARKGVELDAIVEQSLQRAGLWDEVRDRLDAPANSLSREQWLTLV